MLQCMGSQRVGHDLAAEQQQNANWSLCVLCNWEMCLIMSVGEKEAVPVTKHLSSSHIMSTVHSPQAFLTSELDCNH